MQRESQEVILREQLEHDRQMRAVDHVHNLIAQGAKGLGILNAGAVVAILAFIQALVGNPAYLAFKPYAVLALSCFLLGSFLAAINFFFYVLNDSSSKTLWWKVAWGLLITSAACELIGAIVITIGIAVTV